MFSYFTELDKTTVGARLLHALEKWDEITIFSHVRITYSTTLLNICSGYEFSTKYEESFLKGNMDWFSNTTVEKCERICWSIYAEKDVQSNTTSAENPFA